MLKPNLHPMNRFAIVKVNKKAESIIGLCFLIVLCSGCGIRIDRTASTEKCNQAEATAAQAEERSDAAIQELAKGKTDKTVKDNYENLKTRQDAEEQAFEACNPSRQPSSF